MPSTTAATNRAYSDLPFQKLFDYTAGKVSFLCIYALYPKIYKEVLTVHVGLDCAVFTQKNKGADWGTTRLGHKHRC